MSYTKLDSGIWSNKYITSSFSKAKLKEVILSLKLFSWKKLLRKDKEALRCQVEFGQLFRKLIWRWGIDMM